MPNRDLNKLPLNARRKADGWVMLTVPSTDGRAMHKLLRGFMLSFALVAVAGCSGVNELVGNSISAGSPVNVEDQDAVVYRQYFAPGAIINCIAQVRGTPERRSCRDLIAFARMRYADINYEKFRRRAFAAVSGGNAAADITVLGLNAAGTLVPAATTKAILAAISAGVVGSKGIIDKDVLYNAGIQTLILKMDADRAAVRLRITNNLKQNEQVYPFEAAELDAGDYYRAGTLTNALVTLQSDAGATLASDTQVINHEIRAPLPSPPEAVAFSNAARAAAAARPPVIATPVPQAPAAPEPGPGPVIPPVAGGLTPPAPPPSPPNRPAFIAAIRRLPLQNGVLTQTGRKLVDACAAPFGIPAATPVADISRDAGTNLNAITDCINRGQGGL